MLVVWSPDWPGGAAGAPPDSLTAVVQANRVVACSAAARAEGVRPGLRRREAQGRCPELELLAHAPARDARAFEPVLVAVERLTPWVEVLRPGECAFPARGPARYHGGAPPLAVTGTAAVHATVEGRGGCQVGIADGTFAAGLAARHQAIVPPGGSRAFLAPLPVATLGRPDLADLLVRLGLRTLGDLAALPRAALATRFGPEGARAARLASDLDEHPKGARRPPPPRPPAPPPPPPPQSPGPTSWPPASTGSAWPAPASASKPRPTRARPSPASGATTPPSQPAPPAPTPSPVRPPAGRPARVPGVLRGGWPRS